MRRRRRRPTCTGISETSSCQKKAPMPRSKSLVRDSAHTRVLAARSPVLKAKLFGTSATGEFIRIDDMVPQVFEALLHFVYTDSLPEVPGQDDVFMAQHLL
ncbi:hypothetical protein BAE44_0016520 [Dichanthelium oligosanthes]|uniref:BTB domain-containing protein n=1 Tax=Dichanthelium oligosanthes TaxID=888268 RepID=A0A1E5VBI0_9POAL|nr:hypothetical protein BAE44_0016520 [Dichanthelium oligosanthes]